MSYLILHRVRGEPAFDIADKLMIGDEEGWIIPTSGHRAYPLEKWELSVNGVPELEDGYSIPEMPPEWPDHYPMDVGSPPKADFNIMKLISGLLPKMRDRRF